MRRSPLTRFFATLAAAWIVVSLAEPPGLHVCPTHAPLPVTGDSGQRTADREQPNGHLHHAAAPASDETPDPSHDKGCLCLGDCASMFQSASAPTPSIVAVVVEQPHAALPALPEHAPVTRGGLVIPFANGPPVRV